MADEPAGDKTEDATDRKRQQERESGKVAKSKDLHAASILLLSVLILWGLGKTIYGHMMGITVRIISIDLATLPAPFGNEAIPLMYSWLRDLAYTALPCLLAIFFAAVFAGVAQVGFMFTWEPLQPDINKLNPISNLKRMFSLKSVVTLVMNFSKLGLVAGIAWYYIATEAPAANNLIFSEPGQILAYMSYSAGVLALLLALIFFLLGAADMIYQMYQRSQEMKMTKQQIREEMKDTDGDPQIKARRRQIQREMAMQRMMQEVPDAEVVVRNPTHYAVALKFNAEMIAPEVVAKGMNLVALRIIDKAKEHQVPVYQDRWLARQMYEKVEVGEPIPQALFNAVAEVLAFVMRGAKKAEYLESTRKLAGGQSGERTEVTAPPERSEPPRPQARKAG